MPDSPNRQPASAFDIDWGLDTTGSGSNSSSSGSEEDSDTVETATTFFASTEECRNYTDEKPMPKAEVHPIHAGTVQTQTDSATGKPLLFDMNLDYAIVTERDDDGQTKMYRGIRDADGIVHVLTGPADRRAMLKINGGIKLGYKMARDILAGYNGEPEHLRPFVQHFARIPDGWSPERKAIVEQQQKTGLLMIVACSTNLVQIIAGAARRTAARRKPNPLSASEDVGPAITPLVQPTLESMAEGHAKRKTADGKATRSQKRQRMAPAVATAPVATAPAVAVATLDQPAQKMPAATPAKTMNLSADQLASIIAAAVSGALAAAMKM